MTALEVKGAPGAERAAACLAGFLRHSQHRLRSLAPANAKNPPPLLVRSLTPLLASLLPYVELIVTLPLQRLRIRLVALAVCALGPIAATEATGEKRRGTRHSPFRRTALYWLHTPMNRSDVIEPETKSRSATPS